MIFCGGSGTHLCFHNFSPVTNEFFFFRHKFLFSPPQDERLSCPLYALLLTLLLNRWSQHTHTHSIDCNIQRHVKTYMRTLTHLCLSNATWLRNRNRTTLPRAYKGKEEKNYCNLFKRVSFALVERAVDIGYSCRRILAIRYFVVVYLG